MSRGSSAQSTGSHPSLLAPPSSFSTREQWSKPLTPQDRCERWKGPGQGRAPASGGPRSEAWRLSEQVGHLPELSGIASRPHPTPLRRVCERAWQQSHQAKGGG